MAIFVAYKAVMSRGDDVPLDPNEIEAVAKAIATGQLIRVRQGLINPSYLISIVADKDRTAKYHDSLRHEEKNSPKRLAGMEPLVDIFADTPLRLGAGKP